MVGSPALNQQRPEEKQQSRALSVGGERCWTGGSGGEGRGAARLPGRGHPGPRMGCFCLFQDVNIQVCHGWGRGGKGDPLQGPGWPGSIKGAPAVKAAVPTRWSLSALCRQRKSEGFVSVGTLTFFLSAVHVSRSSSGSGAATAPTSRLGTAVTGRATWLGADPGPRGNRGASCGRFSSAPVRWLRSEGGLRPAPVLSRAGPGGGCSVARGL